MSMFVFLNSTLQVLLKRSLLNNISNNKKYLYGRNTDHKSISVREYTVYYLLVPQQFHLRVKIFQLAEQNMYVKATYRNHMFCSTFYINYMHNSLGPIHEFSFWIMYRNNFFLVLLLKCLIFLIPN